MALQYFCVDPDAPAGGDGSTWEVDGSGDSALNIAGLIADIAAAVPGDTYFLKPADSGTITLTADIVTASDGTINAPISIVGVKAATTNIGAAIDDSDFPTGDDRPFIDGETLYNVEVDNWGAARNLRIESAYDHVLQIDGHGLVDNCWLHNDYGSSDNRRCIYNNHIALKVIDCELISDNGFAAVLDTGARFVFCYIHDCPDTTYGYLLIESYSTFLFCIFDTMYMGGRASDDAYDTFFGCTFYNCDYGLRDIEGSATAHGWVIINNIFSECDTEDITFDTAGMDSYIAYNHHYNYTSIGSGIPIEGTGDDLFCDWWLTTGDPKFTTAGSDFSLQSDSPCIGAGMKMELGVG